MSLDQGGLATAFETVLTMPTISATLTGADMALRWANAFDSYATGAVDGLGNSVASGTNKAGFQSALEAAFSDPSTSCIPAITTAINTYWGSGILAVLSLPPGGVAPITNVVSGTPGSVSFDTGLKTSVSAGASAIAGGVHTKATAVTTLFNYMKAGSPPTPDVYNSTLQ